MIRLGMGAMFVFMLALVFVAGSTAGASAHGNETVYQNSLSELETLGDDPESNLSDSGVEGYYKDYVVEPTFDSAEVVAVSSYKYGYRHPTQAQVLGYTAQGAVYLTILYYLYKGYNLTKGAFKR